MTAVDFQFEEFSGSADEVRSFFNRRYQEITEAGGTVLLSSVVVNTHPNVPSARVVNFTYTMNALPGAVDAEGTGGAGPGTDGIDMPRATTAQAMRK